MNKILGIVLPYIMIGIAIILNMSTVVQKELVEVIVIGILLAFWIVAITKCEGTVLMKCGIILSIVLYVAAIILGMLASKLTILADLTPLLILLVCVECAGYYLINKNKPRLAMTYKYSYKDKRRRYF